MSALRVYVAGASAEVDMVAGYIERLRDADVVVTYNWTADVKAARALGRADESMNDDERMAHASRDLQAIGDADVLWLLAPEAATIGAWAELGYAKGLGVSTIVSGPRRRQTIFTAFSRHCETHESAFAYLAERAAAQRSAA